ncbi:MAG: dienelactone hydrolase family protein [Gloeomargarita sp. SKYBB_i_bin120]|nr:dienelactone hydrolase family protein [Gloeomargarita sp. SKYB120]MDW8179217.1 dienelactone hydrolase family protein [Gloeomargarita sp. SKYBB_i_bin120]
MDITTQWVQVPNQDLRIDSYLARPTETGTYPGIIVIQEIFGVNAHIRDVTERIARLGYIAIAPSIYQRYAPGFEVGYSPADMELGRKYKDMTKADELLSDIQATIDYLKREFGVTRFGTIGFCFGGHVVYLAATLPDVQVTASFYGGGIATMTPGGGPPTITRTKDIKGTIWCFFGTRDPLIPNEQADAIEQELKKHNIDHQVFRYDADHGFFCNERDSYDPQAAADSWEKVQQLFSRLRA